MRKHPILWSAAVGTIVGTLVMSGGGLQLAGASPSTQTQPVTVTNTATNPVTTVAQGTTNVAGSVGISGVNVINGSLPVTGSVAITRTPSVAQSGTWTTQSGDATAIIASGHHRPRTLAAPASARLR
jgi:hypothetical protein